jgi:Flp pilus assembly protein TadD
VVELLGRHPNDASIRKSLARIASGNGDTQIAIDLAQQAFALDPLSADMYCFYQQMAQSSENAEWRERLVSISTKLVGEFNCQP